MALPVVAWALEGDADEACSASTSWLPAGLADDGGELHAAAGRRCAGRVACGADCAAGWAACPGRQRRRGAGAEQRRGASPQRGLAPPLARRLVLPCDDGADDEPRGGAPAASGQLQHWLAARESLSLRACSAGSSGGRSADAGAAGLPPPAFRTRKQQLATPRPAAPAMARAAGRVVLVTGGSRGIGLEWVKQLLAQRDTVIATARDASAPTLVELTGHGGRLTVTALDVGSADSIRAWAEALKASVQHVDLLVNNAGVSAESFDQGVADLTPDTLERVMRVNAFGPMLVVKELLAQGLLGGYAPSVVAFTSSIMASMGGFAGAFPAARMYAYRASKAALNMLVLASRDELTAKNITPVLLHPGYVKTDMAPQGEIDPATSVAGQLRVLSARDGRPLSGRFISYTGDELAF
ncbi:oxidoreductase [Scenedesmus sp. PABB004]|nr:oxidoreductase [Scenedesmus sp. PABB004]